MNRPISTDNFNNFYWKSLPIEKDYCNITICSSYISKEFENETYEQDNILYFINKINNKNTQKTIKYILDIMPFTCILNIETYEMFLNSEKLKEDIYTNTNIDINNLKNKKEDVDKISDIVTKITGKITYVNFYNEKNKKDILNITINNNFNKIHRVCIGDISNIPKDTLSLSDYIFFDSLEQINKYFLLSNFNIEIKETNSKIYLVDKCNYKDCQLFSFDNYIK
jgi:hypothetical protein